MSDWEIRSLDDLEAIPIPDEGITWRPIRRALGIRAFGINAYTATNAGDAIGEDDTEQALGHEEVYVVVRGRARFTLAYGECDAPAGTMVYVRDPGTRRRAVAAEPGTAVLAIGGKPGEAFEPSAWEWWFAASPSRERGDYDEALRIVSEGLEQNPDHPTLLYNVACYAALAGHREEALKHLRRAAELQPSVREWAGGDDDLASLRDDPRFAQVLASEDGGA